MRFSYHYSQVPIWLLAALLSACGGGGSSSNTTPPQPTPQYAITGDLSGLLTGESLVLSQNGELISLSANGAFEFTNKLNAGQAYTVTVQQAPPRQRCDIASASGTANDKVHLQVQCVYVPNAADTAQACLDNPELYKPGNTWTVTSPTKSITTTVTGIVPFHEKLATERVIKESDGFLTKSYSAIENGNVLFFGSISNRLHPFNEMGPVSHPIPLDANAPLVDSYFSPTLSLPLALSINTEKPFIQKSLSIASPSNIYSTASVNYKVIYDGREVVETAEGLFETCKITTTIYSSIPFMGYRQVGSEEWILVSGKRAGLPIRQSQRLYTLNPPYWIIDDLKLSVSWD